MKTYDILRTDEGKIRVIIFEEDRHLSSPLYIDEFDTLKQAVQLVKEWDSLEKKPDDKFKTAVDRGIFWLTNTDPPLIVTWINDDGDLECKIYGDYLLDSNEYSLLKTLLDK